MKYLLLLLAIYFPEFGFAQHSDSLEMLQPRGQRLFKALAAPTVLMASGLIAKNYNHRIQSYLNQTIDEQGPKTPSNISDYTQFAPIAMVYAFSAMHNKGEHKILKATSLAVQSEILMIAMVRPLKFFTDEKRPDGGSNSFPSGHTAQAFMAATFLHKEYGKKSIWYSITGYTMATAVGTCRMMSNRHWASDVLVGAGIGILSTNLVYWGHKHRKDNKLNVAAGARQFSVSLKL